MTAASVRLGSLRHGSPNCTRGNAAGLWARSGTSAVRVTRALLTGGGGARRSMVLFGRDCRTGRFGSRQDARRPDLGPLTAPMPATFLRRRSS
jgi:hypothetical protein